MNLAHWFSDTVTVASVASVNSYGQPTFGAGASVPARVESVRRTVRTARGHESVATHVIYTTSAIQLTDRITLPGDSTPRVPLAVTANHDRTGAVTLYEVLIG